LTALEKKDRKQDITICILILFIIILMSIITLDKIKFHYIITEKK